MCGESHPCVSFHIMLSFVNVRVGQRNRGLLLLIAIKCTELYIKKDGTQFQASAGTGQASYVTGQTS